MDTYKTPGVYVKEVSTLPPSVAEVSTAVPAFIGCTANGPKPDGKKVVPVVKRINTLLDYETLFGAANPVGFTVASDGSVSPTEPKAFEYLMYYSLSLYFLNGGGSCYIVSIGNYKTTPTADHFIAGLTALEKEDEPTLVLLTEAVNLAAADYYTVCQKALEQCQKLGDRFVILDVPTDGVDDFRSRIGTKYLMYGAAYYPNLQTSLTYAYNETQVKLTAAVNTSWKKEFGSKGIVVTNTGASEAPATTIVGAGATITFSATTKLLTIKGVTGKTGKDIADAWVTWKADNKSQNFEITINGDGSGVVDAADAVSLESQPAPDGDKLSAIKDTKTALYNQIETTLGQQRVTLPPSAAIAGVYASVDRDRGVWKAPANVSLSGVIGPVIKITHDEQENLNVDTTAGKSINAIRAFTGKGTLVWGARTLAGNDNEWRYISVRRLFNMIEESTQKATSFAVFEPNDATTWLKVKAMIESYLYGLWQQGALAGPTPEDAYFVHVGLGKTMTPQDVLEGRMIVEIGAAAVRPAEFIILRFTHKLQQA